MVTRVKVDVPPSKKTKPGTRFYLKKQQLKMEDEDLFSGVLNPGEFGPQYSTRGKRLPTEKEQRLKDERVERQGVRAFRLLRPSKKQLPEHARPPTKFSTKEQPPANKFTKTKKKTKFKTLKMKKPNQ